ncbi:hypothetical protein TIFTF001_007975 [Ficus carica]|uniref:Uncharacterized protein n=1 Tax=Ficus carica TaxID=3494 RepID=A0AA87ZM76_FICCA|nr:hypothetical protein TIFTF001_007975 [Ficus carica]
MDSSIWNSSSLRTWEVGTAFKDTPYLGFVKKSKRSPEPLDDEKDWDRSRGRVSTCIWAVHVGLFHDILDGTGRPPTAVQPLRLLDLKEK